MSAPPSVHSRSFAALPRSASATLGRSLPLCSTTPPLLYTSLALSPPFPPTLVASSSRSVPTTSTAMPLSSAVSPHSSSYLLSTHTSVSSPFSSSSATRSSSPGTVAASSPSMSTSPQPRRPTSTSPLSPKYPHLGKLDKSSAPVRVGGSGGGSSGASSRAGRAGGERAPSPVLPRRPSPPLSKRFALGNRLPPAPFTGTPSVVSAGSGGKLTNGKLSGVAIQTKTRHLIPRIALNNLSAPSVIFSSQQPSSSFSEPRPTSAPDSIGRSSAQSVSPPFWSATSTAASPVSSTSTASIAQFSKSTSNVASSSSAAATSSTQFSSASSAPSATCVPTHCKTTLGFAGATTHRPTSSGVGAAGVTTYPPLATHKTGMNPVQNINKFIRKMPRGKRKHTVINKYCEEMNQLNEVANNRPRGALIQSIQQENRYIRELQEENKELRLALEEQQNVMELIMSKYREQVAKLLSTGPDLHSADNTAMQRKLGANIERVSEMVCVMRRAAQLDEDQSYQCQQLVTTLARENKGLREMLQIAIQSGSVSSPQRHDVDTQTDEHVTGLSSCSHSGDTDTIKLNPNFSAAAAVSNTTALTMAAITTQPSAMAPVTPLSVRESDGPDPNSSDDLATTSSAPACVPDAGDVTTCNTQVGELPVNKDDSGAEAKS